MTLTCVFVSLFSCSHSNLFSSTVATFVLSTFLSAMIKTINFAGTFMKVQSTINAIKYSGVIKNENKILALFGSYNLNLGCGSELNLSVRPNWCIRNRGNRVRPCCPNWLKRVILRRRAEIRLLRVAIRQNQ